MLKWDVDRENRERIQNLMAFEWPIHGHKVQGQQCLLIVCYVCGAYFLIIRVWYTFYVTLEYFTAVPMHGFFMGGSQPYMGNG